MLIHTRIRSLYVCLCVHFILSSQCGYTDFPNILLLYSFFCHFFLFRSLIIFCSFVWLNVDPESSEVSDWREILYFYIETQHIYMLKTISHNWIDKTFRFHLFFPSFSSLALHFLSFHSPKMQAYFREKKCTLCLALALLRLAIFKRTKFIPFGCATRYNTKIVLLMCFVMGKHVTDRKIWVMKDMENIANSIWCVCTFVPYAEPTNDTKLHTPAKTMLKAFLSFFLYLLWINDMKYPW